MPHRILTILLILLAGCAAEHRDTSQESLYKEHIGHVCKVNSPLQASGYTFKIERNKRTDAIHIGNWAASGPEVTFVINLEVGTKLTLLSARECTNCLFDQYPEYRVKVTPEPTMFRGKPAYLHANWLVKDKDVLDCELDKHAS